MYNEEKEKLKNGFDVLAPDLFDKICAQETPVVTSEEELFGELNEKDPKTHTHFVFKAALASGLAAAVCIVLFFRLITGGTGLVENQIIIDVNPSIQIVLDGENKVIKVEASNKDAERIVSKLEETDSIGELLPAIIRVLQEQKFLSEDSTEMLITYVYQEENKIPKRQVTEVIDQYAKEKKLELTVIQQQVQPDSDLVREAEKSGVSVGKYYLIDKMEEKCNVDKSKYYDKNINEIIIEAEEKGYSPDDSQDITRYDFQADADNKDKKEVSSGDKNIVKDGNGNKEKDKKVSDKKQEKKDEEKKPNAPKKAVSDNKVDKKNRKPQNSKSKEDKKKGTIKIKKPEKSKKEKKEKPDKNNIRPDHDKDTPAKEEKKPSATKSPNEAAVKDNENPGKDNASQGEKPGKGNQPQEDE